MRRATQLARVPEIGTDFPRWLQGFVRMRSRRTRSECTNDARLNSRNLGRVKLGVARDMRRGNGTVKVGQIGGRGAQLSNNRKGGKSTFGKPVNPG